MFNKTLASVWFDECDPWNIFKKVKSINTASQLTKDNCLVLWGGEDIGTELYGEQPNKYADNYEASYRDLVEINCINKAIELEIPIIGVCRGAQLLCVHQKGKLIQHVPNHCSKHKLFLPKENKLIDTNSYHHQTMVPSEEAEIFAISANKCDVGWTEHDKKVVVEVPEIVKWPKIRALGIQGHPEYNDAPQEFLYYTKQLILKL